MLTLETLPRDVLLRILDELSASGFGHSNPVYSLILTSKYFYSLSLPYLYHSVTIRNFRRLVQFLNKDTSRAWKLGPYGRIRHLYIRAAYIDERFLFMPRNQTRRIQRDLAALVQHSSSGCLNSLTIAVEPLDLGLWEESPTPVHLFCVFLGIPAARIECTTANSLPAYFACLEDGVAPTYGGKGNLENNAHLVHLTIPFWRFGAKSEELSHALYQKGKLKSLHLDWPLDLDSQTLARLLISLQDTLEDKGLIIGAPTSDVPHPDETSDYISQTFAQMNPSLTLKRIRAALAKEAANEEILMKKLDWRVPDFVPFSFVPFSEEQIGQDA
jgi:hypothetical protein